MAAVVSRTAWPPCSAAVLRLLAGGGHLGGVGGDFFDAGRHLGGGGAGGLDLASLVGGAAGDAVDDLAELADGGGGLLGRATGFLGAAGDVLDGHGHLLDGRARSARRRCPAGPRCRPG